MEMIMMTKKKKNRRKDGGEEEHVSRNGRHMTPLNGLSTVDPTKNNKKIRPPDGRVSSSNTRKEDEKKCVLEAELPRATDRRKRLQESAERKRKKKKRKIPPPAEAKDPPPRSTRTDSFHSQLDQKQQQQQGHAHEADVDDDYVPTPLPIDGGEDREKLVSSSSSSTTRPGRKRSADSAATSLGKWFPKAVVLKSLQPPMITTPTDPSSSHPNTTTASLLLFYQYAQPLWTEAQVRLLLQYLVQIAQRHKALGGRVRVAREGVNATLSALDHDAVVEKEAASSPPTTQRISATTVLSRLIRDLQHFDPVVFGRTDFKKIEGLTPDRHFKDLKILPVQELVYYGFTSNANATPTDASSSLLDPVEQQAHLHRTGTHVSPQDFHVMLAGQTPPSVQTTTETSGPETPVPTVVIDVRNHYEAILGRFDGQQQQQQVLPAPPPAKREATGVVEAPVPVAQYLDPKMRKSTDFVSWLQRPETKATLQNKRVLMYCTGGVRCERASAHVRQVLGDTVVQGVYQLQGGIEKYLQEFPDGGFWRGKNFVFDKREAMGPGNVNGDGGVVRKEAGATSSEAAHCCVCSQPWDRYVGKRKCSTCGVPVLMCESCMSRKTKPDFLQMRCPLCVEEQVTVPVDQVEWTHNGVRAAGRKPPPNRAATGHNADDDEGGGRTARTKMAPSVLKWGGGHAQDKKERRRFQSIPCRWGSSCTRPDCFFAHPS